MITIRRCVTAKMKYKIHVPTTEYGFIEQELEGTSEEAVDAHNELLVAYRGGLGIETKEFNEALDRYLTENTGETDQYLRMSKDQQAVFQEIKKSLKRIEYKNNKA